MVPCSFKDHWGRCRTGCMKLGVEPNGPCRYNGCTSDTDCKCHSHGLMLLFANRTSKVLKDISSDDYKPDS